MLVGSCIKLNITCSATGTPPTYTALIRVKENWSKVLVNATEIAIIRLWREGNYTCVATNKYGTDIKHFTVFLTGNDNDIRSIRRNE